MKVVGEGSAARKVVRTSRTHPFGFRHAALLAILIAMAVLVRADVQMPTTTRVPGFLFLAVLMGWLLLGSLREHHHPR